MKHKPTGIAVVNPFQAQIAVFTDFKSRRKYYKKTLKINIDDEGHAIARASFHEHEDGTAWFSVCIPDSCNLGTIVHECSHIVDFICDVYGVPINVENTEIRAYMLGVLFMDVCEILHRPIDAVQ